MKSLPIFEILIKITSNEKVDVDIEKLINDNKIVGIIVNDKVIYGENDYIEKVNNYLFKVNINSFFQVNLNILEKIENTVNTTNSKMVATQNKIFWGIVAAIGSLVLAFIQQLIKF